MKILTVMGARPQFVKAAVISRAIDKHNKLHKGNCIKEIIVHTGQHYDQNMSDVFFSEMQIPMPQYHMGISGGKHGAMTGRMLESLESLMVKENPDIVLVYGDTNSTLAGALAAAKLDMPVAHVEAGLRSFNMQMPEEINRILTDRISKWLFCPTQTAVGNLEREGVSGWPGVQIYNTGDVMYEAVIFYRKNAAPTPKITDLIHRYGAGFYLATVHRQENTDSFERLTGIFNGLDEIAEQIPVILPLHPRTRKRIDEGKLTIKNITIIEPIGYLDMLCLLERCKAVFTDSGGLQKEAYFFHKPCITLRDETEWVELVENRFNVLVGANRDRIVDAERKFISLERDFSIQLYGDGKSGEKIISVIAEAFNK